MKTRFFVLYIVLAILFGSAISAAGLYLGKVLPLQERLAEKKYEADENLIKGSALDIVIAVSLRESNQEKTLKILDETILPTDIQIFNKFVKENCLMSSDSAYFLWRIKKYSKDFSVKFPKNEMDIISKVPNERPKFSGKIGNE
ncbi:MAG TPA: hypothetical protein VL981_00330 [Candidatus Methylacidiphilales bacterium]|nr:hypothetical protein [Candidatus Methylacidiphilales bacterium]